MYPMALAAKAANISPKKQRRWLDTGGLPLRGNDRKAHGSGHYCGFSCNRVLQRLPSHSTCWVLAFHSPPLPTRRCNLVTLVRPVALPVNCSNMARRYLRSDLTGQRSSIPILTPVLPI
jgi:hypothetical protein